MSAWRPIDTAPMDGTFFIAWDGQDMDVLNQPGRCAMGRWHRIGVGWGGAAIHFNRPLTHWMPLPEPPA